MYGRFCIKFPQSRMKGERHRLSPMSLWLLKIHISLALMAKKVQRRRLLEIDQSETRIACGGHV
jgi:hypothetical protein